MIVLPFLAIMALRGYIIYPFTLSLLFSDGLTPQITYHRNKNMVFQYLISILFTPSYEHEMLVKVLEIKDFYKVRRCSNVIVST